MTMSILVGGDGGTVTLESKRQKLVIRNAGHWTFHRQELSVRAILNRDGFITVFILIGELEAPYHKISVPAFGPLSPWTADSNARSSKFRGLRI